MQQIKSEINQYTNKDHRRNLQEEIELFIKRNKLEPIKPSHITYKHSKPELIKDTSIYGTKQRYWRIFPDPIYNLSGFFEHWGQYPTPKYGGWMGCSSWVSPGGYAYCGTDDDIQQAIYLMILAELRYSYQQKIESINKIGIAF